VVPVEGPKGLALASGDEIRDGKILLPTNAGWQRFLELAPASGEKFTALKEIGLEWWDRRVPQNLLSGATEKRDAAVTDAVGDSEVALAAILPPGLEGML
jgi:hypothetical protein